MPPIPVATVKPGYKPQSEDTSIDVDVLLFNCLRQVTPLQRVERFIAFNRSTRELALVGNPAGREKEYYLKRRLGDEWLDQLTDPAGKIVISDPITFAQKIAAILEPLTIPYYVGESVASSLQGENRSTEDLDLVIEISSDTQVGQLIPAFQAADFYISETAVADAVYSSQINSSFNVLDQQSIEKADIFVTKDDAFSQSKMARRHLLPIPGKGEIYVCSPEDIILQKLRWSGGRESQKQKRDVLGVLKLQRDSLDYEYLVQWAERLGLTDSLAQVFQEAGI